MRTMSRSHSSSVESTQPHPSTHRLQSGFKKYGSLGLVRSSADRGWHGLAAKLRNHSRGTIDWTGPQSDIEMCVDLGGHESRVTRRAAGIEDRRVATRGTIWLSPPGWQEGSLDIEGDMSGVLHIYLPLNRFSPRNLGTNIDEHRIRAVGHKPAFDDPLLAEMARAIGSELQNQTAAGSLLVETLSASLAARLVQRLFTSSYRYRPRSGGGLDQRRLSRVLDHVESHLEGDLTIDRLSSVACLSRYHFARAFKQATGQSPHSYVSARRLERAKALLVQGDRSLVQIALALRFSCQANFTRAFRQATGQTPGQFRHDRRSG